MKSEKEKKMPNKMTSSSFIILMNISQKSKVTDKKVFSSLSDVFKSTNIWADNKKNL